MRGMNAKSYVYDVSELDFAEKVVDASRDGLVLVDFWASWCAPCRTLAPILERLAEEGHGTLRVAKVDTEKEPRLAQAFRVQSVPFVVAIKDGKPVDAFAGALPEDQLRAFCEDYGAVFGAADSILDAEILNEPLPLAKQALKQADVAGFRAQVEALGEMEEDEDEFRDAERLVEAAAFFCGDLPSEGPAAAALQAAHASWTQGALERCLDQLLESISEDPALAEELARKAIVALFVVHAEQETLVRQVRRRLAILLH
ncbi:MAG: hypothetical protein CSA62_13295 [Planctomycetota bacterium]|nr:MAG: hypothetical protein CSA62_13295 [Planctomycetota bacterium]